MLSKTYARHLKAIGSGEVTKSTVIGLRKIFNAQARKDSGWSVSSVAPKITGDEVSALDNAIATHQPRVTGELHNSGVKLLQNRRNRSRFTAEQLKIIAALDHFRLVGFEFYDSLHCVPLYRAFSRDGRKFLFRNVPWQSGGKGPEAY